MKKESKETIIGGSLFVLGILMFISFFTSHEFYNSLPVPYGFGLVLMVISFGMSGLGILILDKMEFTFLLMAIFFIVIAVYTGPIAYLDNMDLNPGNNSSESIYFVSYICTVIAVILLVALLTIWRSEHKKT